MGVAMVIVQAPPAPGDLHCDLNRGARAAAGWGVGVSGGRVGDLGRWNRGVGWLASTRCCHSCCHSPCLLCSESRLSIPGSQRRLSSTDRPTRPNGREPALLLMSCIRSKHAGGARTHSCSAKIFFVTSRSGRRRSPRSANYQFGSGLRENQKNIDQELSRGQRP